jgi:leucyl aminopeptidase (aminopeptidase T)
MLKKPAETVKQIFETNIGIKKRERVLVFTDREKGDLWKTAYLFEKTARLFTPRTNLVSFTETGSHGMEPPEILWQKAFGEDACNQLKEKDLLSPLISKRITGEKLEEVETIVRGCKRKAVDIIIALSYYSTSHTRFRDLLTRICCSRYASMPIFDRSMFRTALSADAEEMMKRSRKIAGRVDKYEKIEIITYNGTSLSFRKDKREVRSDTGIIRKPGDFSNLPAGEVYLAPVEGTANGRLVLEWAPTRRLKNPVTLLVKNGIVHMVRGKEEYAGYLRKKLAERRENRNIAELGIGTNDMASRPDNILESEKILGTIHIALGDNSSFGGRIRTPFHQDFVFFKPTVTLVSSDNVRSVLMKEGKLAI